MSNHADDLDVDDEIRNSPVPIAAFDIPSAQIIATNALFLAVLRLDADAVPGLELASLFPADHRAHAMHVLAGLEDGTVEFWQGRTQLQSGDGSDVDARYWLRTAESTTEPTAVMACFPIDCPGAPAQKDKVEPGVVIGTLDHAWRISEISAATTGLPGWEPRAALGSPLLSIINPKDAPHVLDAVGRSAAGGGPTIVEARIGSRAGGWRPAHIDLSPLCSHQPPRMAFAISPASGGWIDLTPRRADVFRRLINGERVPDIAESMFISESTVRNHISAIYRTYDVHSQFELMHKLRTPRRVP